MMVQTSLIRVRQARLKGVPKVSLREDFLDKAQMGRAGAHEPVQL